MPTSNIDVFSDTKEIPEYFLGALISGKSVKEKHLSTALWFHLDLLNGGLGQGFKNKSGTIPIVIEAYKQIGMSPLSFLIEEAYAKYRNPFKTKNKRQTQMEGFDALYSAVTYSLPYACSGNQTDSEFIEKFENDWIMRMALKFVRQNRDDFTNIRDAIIADQSG